MQPAYALSDDVFACVTPDRIAFLDLRRNRYLCLREEDSIAVGRQLGLWGSNAPDRLPNECSEDCIRTGRVLSALLDQNLIEPAATTTRPAIVQLNFPTETAAPSTTLPDFLHTHRHIRQFFLACLVASWSLRLRSMQHTVHRVKNRKCHPRRRRSFDLNTLLAIFERLRPLYGRRYICLYDSLALLEFLALHGHFADWIFGVKAEPFGAHCWLQYQNEVLNDSIDYVRNFTPIMVV